MIFTSFFSISEEFSSIVSIWFCIHCCIFSPPFWLCPFVHLPRLPVLQKNQSWLEDISTSQSLRINQINLSSLSACSSSFSSSSSCDATRWVGWRWNWCVEYWAIRVRSSTLSHSLAPLHSFICWSGMEFPISERSLVVFRCWEAPLWKGPSVRPSVRPSVHYTFSLSFRRFRRASNHRLAKIGSWWPESCSSESKLHDCSPPARALLRLSVHSLAHSLAPELMGKRHWSRRLLTVLPNSERLRASRLEERYTTQQQNTTKTRWGIARIHLSACASRQMCVRKCWYGQKPISEISSHAYRLKHLSMRCQDSNVGWFGLISSTVRCKHCQQKVKSL